ncbi:MAG: C25 family cysteine peptidase, partial [Bacteroidota bacterium]
MVLLSRSPVTERFDILENSQPLGSVSLSPTITTALTVNYAVRSPVMTYTRSGNLPDARSVLRFEYQANSPAARGWLDWFEIFYRQRLEAVNDRLHIPFYDTTAVVEYPLSGFSTRDVMIFDVTSLNAVRRITGIVQNPAIPGAVAFQSAETLGVQREYVAVGPTGYHTPANLRTVGNSNVRGISGGAEFVIVTPSEFAPEAERLKAHREGRDGLSTLIVRIDHLFNEYAGGLPDPLAIRDFLADAVVRWQTKPAYLLLFGDGHYDYKNISTTARNWIPPYQSLESLHQINTYVSDDPLVRLTPGNARVTIAAGRFPVNSLREAEIMVGKIISYETSGSFDPWRNRVTYVADDGLTSTGDERNLHTHQAEILAQSYTPASVEKRKVYIVEFPTVQGAAGRRKPAANRAIIDAINRGTVILNFTGHGNPQLWTHEAVFTRE